MLKDDEILKEGYKRLRISCPKCKKERIINVPAKIVNQSEHLTAISVPINFICNHSFQVFIDKNFHVRAYQNADFEISNIEFYEFQPKIKEDLITYNLSILLNKVINILRNSLSKKQILGGAIFNSVGKSLYSALPEDIFLLLSNYLEFQKKDDSPWVKNLFLVFDNESKVLSELLEVENYTFFLVLYFSQDKSINDANSYLKKMKEQIIDLRQPKIRKKKEPSQFWINSKVSKDDIFPNSDSIHIESLGFKVSKSVILNLKEIMQKSSTDPFIGKIYFTEKYVKLMEGLALTIKDAALFMNKLNKSA